MSYVNVEEIQEENVQHLGNLNPVDIVIVLCIIWCVFKLIKSLKY